MIYIYMQAQEPPTFFKFVPDFYIFILFIHLKYNGSNNNTEVMNFIKFYKMVAERFVVK